jgi:hypothetical protein
MSRSLGVENDEGQCSRYSFILLYVHQRHYDPYGFYPKAQRNLIDLAGTLHYSSHIVQSMLHLK